MDQEQSRARGMISRALLCSWFAPQRAMTVDTAVRGIHAVPA